MSMVMPTQQVPAYDSRVIFTEEPMVGPNAT